MALDARAIFTSSRVPCHFLFPLGFAAVVKGADNFLVLFLRMRKQNLQQWGGYFRLTRTPAESEVSVGSRLHSEGGEQAGLDGGAALGWTCRELPGEPTEPSA